MKHLYIYVLLLFVVAGCEVDYITDPNNPDLETVLRDANRTQLNQLGVGLQASARNGLSSFYRVSGAIGRELYTLNFSDLTSTSELLGSMNGGLSTNTMYNAYYDSYSQTRRRAELFIQSALYAAPNAVTDAEIEGIKGFANTIKAYVMLNMLNMQYKNGIRLVFTDLESPGDMLNPGPFATYEESLNEIGRILDEAAGNLDAAGDAFPFVITSGYDGFTTPAQFKRFNRALAARTGVYRQDWTGVLLALENSFLDLDGDLSTGPVFTFSTAAGDQVNPLFQNLNTMNSPVVAQNGFIEDAEPGDLRVEQKVQERDTPRLLNGLVGKYDVYMYPSNTSPVSILRNEELILIYAEAKIHTRDYPEAIRALNRIRTEAGLQTLAEAKPEIGTSETGLIDELLNQRRYSLYAEGHRWFDFRRYGRLNQLPNELPEHQVFEQMIRPFSEVQWDAKHPQ